MLRTTSAVNKLSVWAIQVEIDAVDFVVDFAVSVLQAQHGGVKRNVDQVVEILRGQAGQGSLGAELRADHPDHMEPLFVHLDVLAHRFLLPKQIGAGALAQDAYSGGARVLLGVEEAPRHHVQIDDLLVDGTHAVNDRHVVLRLGNHLGGREALARRGLLNARSVGADGAQVLKGEAGGSLADFLLRLPIGGFLGLHNQIAHAELLDEGHHLLLGAGPDGEHGDHRRHAEDHAEHGQKSAQFVQQKRFQALAKFRHIPGPVIG